VQRSLFDEPSADGRGPRAPIGPIRIGTSSFSSEDWVGPYYPVGTPPAEFLRLYAREFDTVEVDSTYYAIPSARTVDGWATKTPEDFVLAAKFPRSIVHGGEAATPDPGKVLVPETTAKDRDAFLAVMARLGPRLGTLVLQFPYFNRKAFASAGPFLERLDRFLEALPKRGFSFAVEIRNRDWYRRPFRDVCAKHRAGVVLVDQAWMPHGDEVMEELDPVTSDALYVRLLGDREGIEKLTKTWDRVVVDQSARLTRWAKLLAGLAAKGVRSFVYVNNHYAGHAPATVRTLRDLIDSEARRPGA
jgi:uncharacterized protein YecE (DUF72 family)